MEVHFFACGCTVFPMIFVEKAVPPPLDCLCSFVREQLAAFVQVSGGCSAQ